MSTARNRARDLRSSLLASNTQHGGFINKDLNITSIIATRVTELNQINTSVATNTSMKRVYQQLIRHKRRRAMSHDVSRIPKVLREAGYREMLKSIQGGAAPPSKKLHRNFRRSKKMRFISHLLRAARYRWFETHHFHAKRTHMGVRWGYRVPLYTNDKADRAVEKFNGVKAVVCDNSHLELVDINAPVGYLTALLRLTHNYYNNYVEHAQAACETLGGQATKEKNTSQKANQNQKSHKTDSHPTPISPYALSRFETAINAATGDGIMAGRAEVGVVLRYPEPNSIVCAAKSLFPHLSMKQIRHALLQTVQRVQSDRGDLENDGKSGDNDEKNNNSTTNAKNTTTHPLSIPWLTITHDNTLISTTSAMIVAPVRLQWIPDQITAGRRTVWVWAHPSSVHIVSTLFSALLGFFGVLQRLEVKNNNHKNNTNETVSPSLFSSVGLLSGQFSRIAIRGPKSTTVLGRIITPVDSTVEAIDTLSTEDKNTTHKHSPHSNSLQLIESLYSDDESMRIWSQIAGLNPNTTPNASHLNTASQITPNTILSLKVYDPYSKQHDTVQNSRQGVAGMLKSEMQRKSRAFRVNDIGPRFRIDTNICVSQSLDASFDKARVKKNVEDKGIVGGQGGAVNFTKAGGLIENSTGGNKMTFISAQWTPTTASSHPQRYNPPIPPPMAPTVRKQVGEGYEGVGLLFTSTTMDDIDGSGLKSTQMGLGCENNTQNDPKNIKNNLTKSPLNQLASHSARVNPLYDPYYRQQLITYSPGNASAYNCAVRRDVVVPLDVMACSDVNSEKNRENGEKSNTEDAETFKNGSQAPSPSSPSPNPLNTKSTHHSTTTHPLQASVMTHITLISRNQDESRYSAAAGPDSSLDRSNPSRQLQTGWDLIVPRGWGRSFFTAAVKKAGAVMIGHQQLETLGLESANFADSFPHPATYPNSLAGSVVERVKRWDGLITAIRMRKFNYPRLFTYGVFGPTYWSLFHNSPTPHSTLSESNPTSMTDDNTVSLEKPASGSPIVVNKNGFCYTNTSPLNLPPPQQLHLLAEIRRWLYCLVQYHRVKAKKQRRGGARQWDGIKSVLKLEEKVRKKQEKLQKRAKLGSDSQNNDTNPVVALGTLGKTGDKTGDINTVSETTQIKSKMVKKSSTKSFSSKSISPIPNLAQFSTKDLTSLNNYGGAVLAQQRVTGDCVNKGRHDQTNTNLPLYSPYIASSRRSLCLLLRAATIFKSKGDGAVYNHSLVSKPTTIETMKLRALLTSPHSPYFFPPLAWLHKRTHQNQSFLKPIVIGGLGERRLMATKKPTQTTQTTTTGTTHTTQTASTPTQTTTTTTTSPPTPSSPRVLTNIDTEKYEYVDLVGNYSRGEQNVGLKRNFNTIDNLYYHYPLLLNTIHQSQVKYRNNGKRSLEEIMKIGAGKGPQTQKTQQKGHSVVEAPFSTPSITNSMLTALFPRLATFPSAMIDLFTTAAQIESLTWVRDREWLIDAVVLFCVLQNQHHNYHHNTSIDSTTSTQSQSLINIDSGQQGHGYGHKNQQKQFPAVLPIRLEQLSMGHIPTNGVLTIPSNDELNVVYHHQFKSSSEKALELNQRAVPKPFWNKKLSSAAGASKTADNIKSTKNTITDANTSQNTTTLSHPTPQDGLGEIKCDSPLGFVTFVHQSMKLGQIYGLGFISIEGYIDVLEAVLAAHHVLPTAGQIDAMVERLQGLWNRGEQNNTKTEQTSSKKNHNQDDLIIFDPNLVVLPIAVHGESNKKLAWAKIRFY